MKTDENIKLEQLKPELQYTYKTGVSNMVPMSSMPPTNTFSGTCQLFVGSGKGQVRLLLSKTSDGLFEI